MNKRNVVVVLILILVVGFVVWGQLKKPEQQSPQGDQQETQSDVPQEPLVEEGDTSKRVFTGKKEFFESFLQAFYTADYKNAYIESNYDVIKDYMTPEVLKQFERPTQGAMFNPNEEPITLVCSIEDMGAYFEETNEGYYRAVGFVDTVQSVDGASPQKISQVIGVKIQENGDEFVITDIFLNTHTRDNFNSLM